MSTNITQLSTTIAENVNDIRNLFVSRNTDEPTWDGDIPPSFHFDQDYTSLRKTTLKACKQLIAVLQHPWEVITNRTPAEMVFIHAICRFGMATKFPKDKDTVTYNDLAKACHMPEPEMRRIVRGAMTIHVFREKDGAIAHTPTSNFLATNPLIREWIDMTFSEVEPAKTRVVDAMTNWPRSEEPNHSGYNIANHTNDTTFVHMAKVPGRVERFVNAMTLFSQGPGLSPEHLLSGFPWGTIGQATLVDIGGSHGQITIGIVRRFPNVKCIIQDLPGTIAAAPQLPEFEDRVSFMAHDFFEEQPVKGAEVYLLRWVLHDWSDKYAIKILQALVPALRKSSRVIIMEAILPDPQEVPSPDQREARTFDVAMMALQNGKEREKQDWISLIHTADVRFKVQDIKQLPGSNLGIIELMWEG